MKTTPPKNEDDLKKNEDDLKKIKKEGNLKKNLKLRQL